MAVPWGLIAVVVGAAYGYAKKGKQDKKEIMKTGALWGVIIAAVLAILGGLAGQSALGVGTGLLAMVVGFLLMALLFVGGVFLGDWIEQATA